jgi:hypothetical protein
MLPDIFFGTMAFVLAGLGASAGVAGAVGAVVTFAAGALSAYGTYQQGKANERVANMNADLANQEARQQFMIADLQQRLSEQQANAQFEMDRQEAIAARLNASAMDQERIAGEARSREEIRRRRTEAEAVVAEQRALFAASGVVGTTGTPLQVMADSVLTMEAEVIDQQYLTNVERTKQIFEADVERNRAGRIEGFAGAQKAINLTAAKVEGLAMRVGARNRQSQADIDRQAGRYLRKQSRITAMAQLASGAVNAAGGLRSPSPTVGGGAGAGSSAASRGITGRPVSARRSLM